MTTLVDLPLLNADEIASLALQGTHVMPLIHQREVHDHHAGDWPSIWLGRGLDFEEARPYAPGDDLRDMDWRTTARLGLPFIKTYREERQPLVHLVIDRGPSMRFGTRRRLKVAQAARAALLAGFSANARDMAVGITLWDQVDTDFSARHGRSGLLELVQAIVAPCPPVSLEHTETVDTLTRLQHLGQELPRGSKLLILSDFAWLTPQHGVALASLAERLDLRTIAIFDPVEQALPELGLVHFYDISSRKSCWLDTGNPVVREKHARTHAERVEVRQQLMTRCGVSHLELRCDIDDLLPAMHGHG